MLTASVLSPLVSSLSPNFLVQRLEQKSYPNSTLRPERSKGKYSFSGLTRERERERVSVLVSTNNSDI